VPRYRGIWRNRREDQVSFSLIVHLPTGWTAGRRSPSYINFFETDLSIFRHKITKLADAVTFGTLKLRTSNAGIVAGGKEDETVVIGKKLDFRTSNGAISASAGGEKLDITTSNGRITGSFTTNDVLIIHTSNGAIDVNAKLLYSKNSTRDGTVLDLKTSNGRITASVDLENPGSDKGGTFYVESSSSNGAIDLKFPHSPHTSTLKLHSSTSNSRQQVYLSEAYEGTWDVSTSSHIGVPDVAADPSHTYDPSGQKRERKSVTEVMSKGKASGKVSWGDWDKDAKHYGSVSVRTSNGKPTLRY